MERHIQVHMKNNGFTLLELMITISLLVILLGIGIPSLKSLLSENSLSFQSQMLLKHMRFARSQAIDNQQTVTACLADASNKCVQNNPTYYLVFVDSNNNNELNSGEILLSSSQQLADGITATANRISTTYSLDGTSIGTNATLSLCETGQIKINIVTAQSGRSSSAPQATVCP
ncbi:GspH/FimT family pseudopilin [Aeromonas sp. HMWF014]|jgi:type IV fimbrial biogenesis protein FimT|uniref:GspH/FimT family pseudopilin n=1 Tax=Aeromonas sp. HMWF014 TaxID=2056850 RepID=UPI002159CA00|nr:GspH/FimT family pseudopilin [Aeromonas sp. HMWF014]